MGHGPRCYLRVWKHQHTGFLFYGLIPGQNHPIYIPPQVYIGWPWWAALLCPRTATLDFLLECHSRFFFFFAKLLSSTWILDSIHPSIIKYLLRTYYVQDTDLGTRDTTVIQQWPRQQWSWASQGLGLLWTLVLRKQRSTCLPVCLVPCHFQLHCSSFRWDLEGPWLYLSFPLSYLQQPDTSLLY